jgi:CubicO group peptidase (beta-lactamase class C family)
MATEHDPADRFDAVRAFIRQELVAQGVASLAVAVAQEGALLWEEGFGWADRERRLPADAHTPYSLASISKPLTATGLMILVERGAVDLDRPINDYLGPAKLVGRAGDAAGATVRRVANHTAGLPLHYHFFPEDEQHPRPPMEETIRRYGVLVSAPGERYQYSNLGYGLLDHLIARVSGRSYAAFMRREVFLPLGMTRSSVGIGPGLEPFAAARYGEGGERLPFYDFDHPGGSAIFASAHDLARFGLFHLKEHLADQRAILSDAAIDTMQQPTAPVSAGVGYGVGLQIVEGEAGYRGVEHDGGMMGVTTTLQLLPAQRLVVVALANTAARLPHQVAERIVATLAPEAAAHRAVTNARRQAERTRADASGTPFRPPPELLGAWAGTVATFSGETPLALRFQEDGDIHVRLGDRLWTLVNEPRLVDDRLTGAFGGELADDPTLHAPYDLHLDLKWRGSLLSGALIAKTRQGARIGDALSHWAELRRAE